MSRASRLMQVGTRVTTDFSGRITEHEIVKRVENWQCQSGIGFYVHPIVPKSGGDLMDADWFEPVGAAHAAGNTAQPREES